MAYVYILECGDGSLYTGTARELFRRMRDHFEKTPAAAAYTRAKGVRRLVLAWECDGISAALRAEAAIKRLTRREKEELLASPSRLAEGEFPTLSGLFLRPLSEDEEPLLTVRRHYG
ncbi:MAG: GIY-YIG nuclease family protein [Clostridia bacterium]|nr:GIY-YIG nuclease family protein [Clostridia bacterium]